MAETWQEKYNILAAELQSMGTLTELQPQPDDAQTFLNDLTSSSKVSDHRLWMFIWSYAASIEDMKFEEFMAEINQIANRINYGTLQWYVTASKQYQHGYSLTFNQTTQRFEYAQEDELAKIIANASATEINGEVIIKVTKSGGVPLTQSELSAFEAYIDKLRPAGINTTVRSEVPDKLKVSLTIYKDPLVMDDNGELYDSPGTFPVQDAIEQYLTELPFDGRLVLTFLQDAVQSAKGVVNPVINNAFYKYGQTAYMAIIDEQKAFSGLFEIDTSIPYAQMLNYVNYE